MTDISKLSISWISELNILNNQLRIKAIALDKVIQIEFNAILFISIESQSNTIEEIGNVVDIAHQYQVLAPDDAPYSYITGNKCHIITIYGDYMIKLICNDIHVFTLD